MNAALCDPNTGYWPGWLPVGAGPEDQWHREAFDPMLPDGTYELVGPKVQGNLYNLASHALWPHGAELVEAPRTFAALKTWFAEHPMEGLVWHHSDGRMCKVKTRDFGLPWPRGGE